jgi:hypothetical protein
MDVLLVIPGEDAGAEEWQLFVDDHLRVSEDRCRSCELMELWARRSYDTGGPVSGCTTGAQWSE